MAAPLNVKIEPFGFLVTDADLDPVLKFRVEARIAAEEERREVLRKLMRNMLLDLETLSLVNETDLTTEVALTQRYAHHPPAAIAIIREYLGHSRETNRTGTQASQGRHTC
jgi:hypothetical protein